MFRMLRVGACRHLECMAARGGRLAVVDFPALCGLIHHPLRGWILFDTGYAQHFQQATRHWPERLYSRVLPVDLPADEDLIQQLGTVGIRPTDISTVIISHYHGDHIAGLRDFPNARFIALRTDTETITELAGHRWRATLQGILPGLLPVDFFQRLEYADAFKTTGLPSWMRPFDIAIDLFGDGSVLGVPLPGHSKGQLGLFLSNTDRGVIFLVADACWSLPACKGGKLPSRLAMFTNANKKAYTQTFMDVRELALREPAINILPSHCTHSWNTFRPAR